VEDAEAYRNEQHVPDWVEQCHRALNRGRGYGLALGSRELVSKLGDAQLELAGPLLEFGQPLGGHVAPGFVATDGLQHALALLAAPLLFGGELREFFLDRRRALGASPLQDLGHARQHHGSAAIVRMCLTMKSSIVPAGTARTEHASRPLRSTLVHT